MSGPPGELYQAPARRPVQDERAGFLCSRHPARASLIDRALELPALVRPGPVGRCGMDLLLDEPCVALGELTGGSDLTALGERLERHFVMTARCAPHGDEEHRETCYPCDLLRTHVERGVATEEVCPILVLARGRLLVCHHGDGTHHIPPLEDIGQQLL